MSRPSRSTPAARTRASKTRKDQRKRRAAPAANVEAVEALRRADAAVTLELDGSAVGLTQLDKVLWPAAGGLRTYTRRDYLQYLLLMAPHMLRHLQNRPLTLIRQPDGALGRRFVHFHYEQNLPPFVDTVRIYSAK